MPGPLKKPQPFKRKGRGLPGQSSDDDLSLDSQTRYIDRPSSTIINKDLVQIGDIGGGRYVEISIDGVRLYSNGTLLIDLQADGDLILGDINSGRFVSANADGVELYSNDTKQIDLDSGGDVFIGDVASGDYVKISSAGVEQWVGGTKLVDVQTGDVIYVGSSAGGEYVKISSAAIELYSGGSKLVDIQSDGDVYIGNVSGGEYAFIDSGGIELYASAEKKIDLQSDGDVFIGDDVTTPGKTYFAIFSNAQTYNTESVGAGDMIIGDNSSSKANILWDKSMGILKFRGGKTTRLYIDTDGSLNAGGGDVVLDSDGLTLAAGTSTPNKIKIDDGSDTICTIYAQVDASTSQLEIISQGKDSGDPEALATIQALTHDGTPHSGAAQVYLELDTANDEVVAAAETVRGMKVVRLTGITTTARNALPAINGQIIYNTTTGKFQGRAGGSWIDLH